MTKPRPRLFGWRTVVVCLVVGVVVNVGVAWGLALRAQLRLDAPRTHSIQTLDNEVGRELRGIFSDSETVDRLDWPPGTGVTASAPLPDAAARLGWGRWYGYEHWDARSATPYVHVEAGRAGLPTLSLAGFRRATSAAPSRPGSESAPWQSAWRFDTGVALDPRSHLNDTGFVTASLPLRPILPGFIVNTLFYTTLVFAPVVGARVVRRHRRAKRGRCIACGYEVGGIAVCPECGVASSPRRGAGV